MREKKAEMLRAKDVSARTGLPIRTVNYHARKGRFAVVQVGRSRFILWPLRDQSGRPVENLVAAE